MIVRRIDEYLEKDRQHLNRQQRGNVRYQLARAAAAFALLSPRPRANAVSRFQLDVFDNRNLGLVFDWIVNARSSAERAAGTSDENVLAKGAEWSREMDRRFSRYATKGRWPKRLAAAFGWPV
jgi:hypothetical protein